jgi:hypothetical protein
MALQSIAGDLNWPGGAVTYFAGAPSLGALDTFDAAGEYGAMILQAQEDMTISHVGFRTAGATGSPTADVRIETLASTGFPSGTLWATNTNIVTGTLSANTVYYKGIVYCGKTCL